jgi:hypothetical protein
MSAWVSLTICPFVVYVFFYEILYECYVTDLLVLESSFN